MHTLSKTSHFLVFRWFPSNTTYAAHIFWIDNTMLFFFLLSLFRGFMGYVSSWCIKTLSLCFLATSEVNFVALCVAQCILWCFLIWLLFLTNTYCDGSMHLSNHDPIFYQLKFYCPWCFWYFFCSCYLQLVLMMMMMMMMKTRIDCSSMPKNKIQILTSKFKPDH